MMVNWNWLWSKQPLLIKHLQNVGSEKKWNPIIASAATAGCYGEIYLSSSICFSVGFVLFPWVPSFPCSFRNYFYHPHGMMFLAFPQSLIIHSSFTTGWRMHAPSWCRLPPCWKPTLILFLPGITSLMVPGASSLGPLISSWPLMRLRYAFLIQKCFKSKNSHVLP